MQLSSFKTYIGQTFKRTDKDDEIVQSYNDAIIAVAAIMPHSIYKYQSYLPLIAKQEDYPLPSNMMHIMHPVKILEGSGTNDSGWQLEHITKADYDARYPNPNRTDPTILGVPAAYTIYSGSILVGPLPEVGTDDLLEIDWTKTPVDQSADTDTPGLPDYWRGVLRQMTLKRLYEGIELTDEATYWRAQYEDKYGNPVGEFKRLWDIEKDKELHTIGIIRPNAL